MGLRLCPRPGDVNTDSGSFCLPPAGPPRPGGDPGAGVCFPERGPSLQSRVSQSTGWKEGRKVPSRGTPLNQVRGPRCKLQKSEGMEKRYQSVLQRTNKQSQRERVDGPGLHRKVAAELRGDYRCPGDLSGDVATSRVSSAGISNALTPSWTLEDCALSGEMGTAGKDSNLLSTYYVLGNPASAAS